jgi:hypothetical protein
MNPFDFYYLDDFLKFSPLSPNYANLNNIQEKYIYIQKHKNKKERNILTSVLL